MPIRFPATLGLPFLCAGVTVIGAHYLTLYFDTLPFNMPQWLDMAIGLGFKVFLHDNTPNPDDMAAIALLFHFACALVLTGSVVVLAATMLWRRIVSPHLPHANKSL